MGFGNNTFVGDSFLKNKLLHLIPFASKGGESRNFQTFFLIFYVNPCTIAKI